MNSAHRAAWAIVILIALEGCGKQTLPQTSAAQDQAQAKAASDAMLAEDSARFKAIAEGQGTPAPAKEDSNPFPPPGSERETAATKVAPPQTVALVTPPAVVPQTFGFDDSPDGLEAKRLLSVFIAHLKDPDSAKFQNIKSATFTQKTGRLFGVCGEVNAKNAYGGYTGVKGFVVFKDDDGRDEIYMESSSDIEALLWGVLAKEMGCVSQ